MLTLETISCLLAAGQNPADLVRDVAASTGAVVRFYALDGQPLDESGGEAAPAAATLVGEAVRYNEDRYAAAPDGLRAAFLIRRRGLPVLVAAAELPDAGPADTGLGYRLLAAVGELVRARFEQADVCAECASTSEVLTQSFEEISLLHSLGEVLRVTQPVDELLRYVCDELRATTEAEAAVACLPAEGERPPLIVVSGRLPFLASDLPALVTGLLESLGPEQTVLINNHCQSDPALVGLSMALERLVLVPLAAGEGRRGAIAAFNRGGAEFGSPDAKLIRSSAGATAVFIENRRLYDELQAMMLDLVRALVSSIDAKDPYTCGHSSRVAVTCREIARRMGMGEEESQVAYLAGLLHDVGKIGTPEAILSKEGYLEPEERAIIQQHPDVGGKILGGIRKLGAVCQAVRHHHERFDGGGYPDRLAGDMIPVAARIVGLADAFDAMTSNRPYRPLLPLEHVLHEIQTSAGGQFDPRVAEAFFSLDLERLLKQFEAPVAALEPQP